MKQFFEEYGGIALGILALLVLIAMITPVGNIIKTSLQGTAHKFSTSIDGQMDDAMNATASAQNDALNVIIGSGGNGGSSPSNPQVQLINFMIDGVSYQAEEGMTFDEWINSDYSLSLPRQKTFTCEHCGESVFNLVKIYHGAIEDYYLYFYGSETKLDTVYLLVNNNEFVKDSYVINNGDSIFLGYLVCND